MHFTRSEFVHMESSTNATNSNTPSSQKKEKKKLKKKLQRQRKRKLSALEREADEDQSESDNNEQPNQDNTTTTETENLPEQPKRKVYGVWLSDSTPTSKESSQTTNGDTETDSTTPLNSFGVAATLKSIRSNPIVEIESAVNVVQQGTQNPQTNTPTEESSQKPTENREQLLKEKVLANFVRSSSSSSPSTTYNDSKPNEPKKQHSGLRCKKCFCLLIQDDKFEYKNGKLCVHPKDIDRNWQGLVTQGNRVYCQNMHIVGTKEASTWTNKTISVLTLKIDHTTFVENFLHK